MKRNQPRSHHRKESVTPTAGHGLRSPRLSDDGPPSIQEILEILDVCIDLRERVAKPPPAVKHMTSALLLDVAHRLAERMTIEIERPVRGRGLLIYMPKKPASAGVEEVKEVLQALALHEQGFPHREGRAPFQVLEHDKSKIIVVVPRSFGTAAAPNTACQVFEHLSLTLNEGGRSIVFGKRRYPCTPVLWAYVASAASATNGNASAVIPKKVISAGAGDFLLDHSEAHRYRDLSRQKENRALLRVLFRESADRRTVIFLRPK
jgi:hypothetical protein